MVTADAFRDEVLQAARAFKASWTGLARVLTRVRDQALWRSWGFSSFEVYCSKELRIRKATALKLTRSWTFLERHERGWRPDSADAKPAPAFEVVEVRLGQLARTARRLAEELRVCRGVPASVRTQADDLAAAVEALALHRTGS